MCVNQKKSNFISSIFNNYINEMLRVELKVKIIMLCLSAMNQHAREEESILVPFTNNIGWNLTRLR